MVISNSYCEKRKPRLHLQSVYLTLIWVDFLGVRFEVGVGEGCG